MKKIIYSFVVVLLSVNANAQIQKGNWLVGGSGKLYSYKSQYESVAYNNEATYTEVEASATLGYFLLDKVAVGIRPSFTSIKGEVTTAGGGSTNTQRYWIGPFVRLYFMEPSKQLNILTDISYQYGFYGRNSFNGKLGTFSVMAGPVVYLNSSVGIEFLAGYRSSFEDTRQLGRSTRSGFQMGIGFQIHLEK